MRAIRRRLAGAQVNARREGRKRKSPAAPISGARQKTTSSRQEFGSLLGACVVVVSAPIAHTRHHSRSQLKWRAGLARVRYFEGSRAGFRALSGSHERPKADAASGSRFLWARNIWAPEKRPRNGRIGGNNKSRRSRSNPLATRPAARTGSLGSREREREPARGPARIRLRINYTRDCHQGPRKRISADHHQCSTRGASSGRLGRQARARLQTGRWAFLAVARLIDSKWQQSIRYSAARD